MRSFKSRSQLAGDLNSMSKQASPLLSKNGVLITTTHLSAGGKTFAFAKIIFVRVEQVYPSFLASILRRNASFRLVISTAADASPVTVFETRDVAFMEKVQKAMDLAARANPHGKRTR
jgi:hypothetical protein